MVRAAVELGGRALSVGEWGQAAWAACQGLRCAPADASLHGLVLRAAVGAGDWAEIDRARRDAAAALGDEEREVTLGVLYRQLGPPTPD